MVDTNPIEKRSIDGANATPARAWAWLVRLVLLVAASIATYLSIVAFSQYGLPAGCGMGSSCAEVLTSRWSSIIGLPVSLPAIFVYTSMLLATFVVTARSSGSARRSWAWGALVWLSFVVCLSAAWFIVVQYFILDSICRYCMAVHAAGLMAAALVFWQMPTAAPGTASLALPIPKQWLALLGLLTVACFIALQWAMPSQGPAAARLPAGQNADSGPGAGRQIALLQGELQLALDEEPIIGSSDADKMLVLMFDYCCPHCRRAHTYLLDAFDRYPDQFAIVALPVPLNTDCNPTWPKTGSRFKDSCELARLALSVAKADRQAFAEFDRWLFESDAPRELHEARDHAIQLVGSAALEAALAEEAIDERIHRNVSAYASSNAERIPVVASPGFAAVVGRPSSADELYGILEADLQLVPRPTSGERDDRGS